MQRKKHIGWQIIREALAAALVLTLVLFNMGPASAAYAHDSSGAVTLVVSHYCGEPLGDGGIGHTPCHACRPDAAALPPPPVAATPVRFAVTPATYPASLLLPSTALSTPAIQPRGPPAA